jgi:H+/Cl- antiporter ClcA
MRAWEVIKPFWGWLMVATGLLLTAFIVAAYRDIMVHKRSAKQRGPNYGEFPQDLSETDHGVPWSLWLLYIVCFAGAVWYVLWMWRTGHVY